MERSPRLHRPLTPLPRLFLQLLNERLMGAEGTKMDDDFLKMEKVKPLITVLIQETVLPPTKKYTLQRSFVRAAITTYIYIYNVGAL